METFDERHSYNRPVAAPFSREIRDFLAESRRRQTLYSNCEGAYDRRVFKKDDADSLKDYIYNTIYYSGGDEFRLSGKGIDSQKVDSFQRRIFERSRRFGLHDEAHVTVVWVHCFVFSTGTRRSLPVFKIYKTKLRDDAVFLGMDLKNYESWDSYLEGETFPDAFLCVPRHGQYYFDPNEGKLDLEFVTSRRAPKGGKISTPEYPLVRSYTSFCEVVVRPMIVKMKEFCAAVMGKVKAFLQWLQDMWDQHRGGILRGIVFVIAILKGVFLDGGMEIFKLKGSSFLQTLRNFSLMLLNVHDRNKCIYEKLHEGLRSFGAGDTPSLTLGSELLPIQQAPEDKSQLDELFALFKEGKKNWRKILKIFCSLFRQSRPVLMAALSVCTVTPLALGIASLLFTLVEILEESAFLNPPEQVAIEYGDGSSLGGTRATEQNSSSVPDSRDEVKPSTSSNVTEEFRKCLDPSEEVGGKGKAPQIALEKLLPGLGDLEEDSARNIEEKALACDLTGSFPHPVVNTCVVQDVDDNRICFIRKASLPHLTEYCTGLLGTDISLKRGEAYVFNVASPTGSILGDLYFLKDFTAIGLFPLKNIAQKEEEQIKIIK